MDPMQRLSRTAHWRRPGSKAIAVGVVTPWCAYWGSYANREWGTAHFCGFDTRSHSPQPPPKPRTHWRQARGLGQMKRPDKKSAIGTAPEHVERKVRSSESEDHNQESYDSQKSDRDASSEQNRTPGDS